jgi:hypothetical protein
MLYLSDAPFTIRNEVTPCIAYSCVWVQMLPPELSEPEKSLGTAFFIWSHHLAQGYHIIGIKSESRTVSEACQSLANGIVK